MIRISVIFEDTVIVKTAY